MHLRAILAPLARILLASLLAIMAAGCAVMPPQLPQQLPREWQHALVDAQAPAADLRQWWRVFDDAGLDALVASVLEHNLSLRESELRVEAARILAGQALAPYLPQVNLHTYSEPTPDSSASYFQMGFDAKWELALFGRKEIESQLAAGELGLAESTAQATRVRVIAEVVRAAIELRAARERLALQQQLAADAARLVELTRTRLGLRLAAERDLGEVEAAQARAEAALQEPQLAVDIALRQLALLLGRDTPDSSWLSETAPLRLGAFRLHSPPAEMLRTRPEIRRAESEVLQAAGELGLARTARLPRIGIGGSLTYSAKVIGGTRLANADSIVTVGPAIELPLFDWGMRKAQAEANEKTLAASVLAYRQAVLEGLGEAETALAQLAAQGERSAALRRALETRRRDDAASAVLLRLGLSDQQARLEAQRVLLEAELELAAAERERSIAFVALYKALGGAPLPAARSKD